MTLAQLCRAISRKHALTDAAGSDDLEFLYAAANRGVREVLLETHCYVVNDTLAITAGDNEYELDTGWLAVVDYTTADPTSQSLNVVPSGSLLARRRIGVGSAARRFSLLGHNLLLIEPTPSENATWTFYVVPVPTNPLDSGADDPSVVTFGMTPTNYGGIPEPLHRAIEMWMSIEACELNKDYRGIEYYSGQFRAECVKARKRIRDRAGRRLAGSRVGYPETTGILPARGVDTG